MFVPDGGIYCVQGDQGDCFSHGGSIGGSASVDWIVNGMFIEAAYCGVTRSQRGGAPRTSASTYGGEGALERGSFIDDDEDHGHGMISRQGGAEGGGVS